MPQTEEQRNAALAEGRRIAGENRVRLAEQQAQVLQQQTQPARFTWIARRRLKVGDGWREVGDEVPEAETWPNRQAYLNEGHIEEVPVIDGQLPRRQEHAAQTLAPEDYDTRTPTPGPVVGSRHPEPRHLELSCVNCRVNASQTLNYVPEDTARAQGARFECWLCQQQQLVIDAMQYPPQSFEDWQRAGFRQGGQ
jgi:hypothetical protein